MTVGDIVDATVTRVFVGAVLLSRGSMIGALQLPEISWFRTATGTARFSVGDTVRVLVIAVKDERFSASIRQLHPEQDPWLEAQRLSVGDELECVVRRVVEYGAWCCVGAYDGGLWIFAEGDVPPVVGQRVALVVSRIDEARRTIELRPRSGP